MPAVVGALNERHTDNDARFRARAPTGRAALVRRTGPSVDVIAVDPCGLKLAARPARGRVRGAAQPAEAGLPDPESTRNLLLPERLLP